MALWLLRELDFTCSYSCCFIIRYGGNFQTSSWDFHLGCIYGMPALVRGDTSQNGRVKYLWC